MIMEKKEQDNKAMQPLSEAELEQVNGGLTSAPSMKRLYSRKDGDREGIARAEAKKQGWLP